MEYKGYTATIQVDEDDGMLVGTIEDIRDVITFEALTVREIEIEFHKSVDEYLAYCAESGTEPEKPYSGKFPVRTTPALHKAAVAAARRAGLSLNAWVSRVIEHHVGGGPTPNTR